VTAIRSADAAAGHRAEDKTPPRTISFWLALAIVPIAGETTADLLAGSLALGLVFTTMVVSVVLTAALLFQLHATRYAPAAYWATVCTTAVLGTLASDDLAGDLGIPLDVVTLALAIGTGVAFAVWFAVERSVDAESTTTRRRELFYWVAVAGTLAFGTAAADLAVDRFRIEYIEAMALLGAVVGLLVIASLWMPRRMPHATTLVYWLLFLLVPLLGGAIERFIAAPTASGGVGLGGPLTCAFAWLAIAMIVTAMTVARAAAGRSRIAKEGHPG
jgi:uncharacterized membrane-anchored protein